MYTLHIANKNYSSWSLRPWLLLTELNIPFKEVLTPFSQGTSWAEFREFCPTGLVPCLLDGDTQVWDSLAITEYIAEDHPSVWPEDKKARAWARSATAEMHSGFNAIRNECSMNCALRVDMHAISPALKKNLARLDELWSEGLNRFGGPFLTGERFTAVDAFFAPIAFRAQTYDLPLSNVAKRYIETLLSLEGMKQWQTDGIAEPWREPGHEEEVLQAGTIVKDYRAS